MKHLELEQGSPEWEQARIGIPTASQFSRILTPKKLEYATGAVTYRNELLTEWVIGSPIQWASTGTGPGGWLDRGKEMEAEARAWYEFEHDLEVERVGFILRDDGKAGGSPDCLVGEDGGVDFKCPAMHTHIGYMLDPSALVDQYRHQIQGYMYLTERTWWELVSYNPDLPAVVQRVERDGAYIAALETALARFIADLEAAKETLQSKIDAHAGPAPDVEDSDFQIEVHAPVLAPF